MPALSVVWGVLRPILTFGITLPLWVFIAAGVWLWFDKTSDIRKSVNNAVTELVDGAELEAERARNAALQKIIERKDRIAERDREAHVRFSELLSAAEDEKDGLANELEALEALPPPDQCIVDRSLLERLR